MKDPYQVLGLSRGASEPEVRAAFRRLGKEHHPDRNPGDEEALRRFKEINAAYQILSDPQKRSLYDRFGAAGLGGAGGPFSGMPFDLGDLNIDGIFGDLLDVLGIRFGDKGNLRLTIELTFEEAAFGCTKVVHYDRVARCVDCTGTGAESGADLGTCAACQGRGRVRVQQSMFPIAVERTCSRCHGTGRMAQAPCRACGGVGLRTSPAQVDVEIPAGIEPGATRRIPAMGNLARNRGAGDLELLIRVKTHEFFRRSGDNVICALPITFAQAALGDEIEIPTMDGKGVLRVPPGTQPGTTLRIRGKGVPRRVGGRGDQLIEIQVEIPTSLTARQQQLIEELANDLGEAVQPQTRTIMDKLKDLFD